MINIAEQLRLIEFDLSFLCVILGAILIVILFKNMGGNK